MLVFAFFVVEMNKLSLSTQAGEFCYTWPSQNEGQAGHGYLGHLWSCALSSRPPTSTLSHRVIKAAIQADSRELKSPSF